MAQASDNEPFPNSEASEAGYMAFISYSHSDNREESRKWADWLHQALETYEIPADLIGKPNQAGQPVPRQIYTLYFRMKRNCPPLPICRPRSRQPLPARSILFF